LFEVAHRRQDLRDKGVSSKSLTLLFEENMGSLERWFVSFKSGCSEGQRWNGRTQSYVSRSPAQQIKEKVDLIGEETEIYAAGKTLAKRNDDSAADRLRTPTR
jgi:hypothetical protein